MPYFDRRECMSPFAQHRPPATFPMPSTFSAFSSCSVLPTSSSSNASLLQLRTATFPWRWELSFVTPCQLKLTDHARDSAMFLILFSAPAMTARVLARSEASCCHFSHACDIFKFCKRLIAPLVTFRMRVSTPWSLLRGSREARRPKFKSSWCEFPCRLSLTTMASREC